MEQPLVGRYTGVGEEDVHGDLLQPLPDEPHGGPLEAGQLVEEDEVVPGSGPGQQILPGVDALREGRGGEGLGPWRIPPPGGRGLSLTASGNPAALGVGGGLGSSVRFPIDGNRPAPQGILVCGGGFARLASKISAKPYRTIFLARDSFGGP